MQLVCINAAGKASALHLSFWQKIALLSSVIFFMMMLVAAGVWLGQSRALSFLVVNPAVAQWQTDLAQQKELVSQSRLSAQAELDSLSKQTAQLQAYVMRIDALGERLVNLAGLDGSEFAFGQPPAVGGPDEEMGDTVRVSDFVAQLDQMDARIGTFNYQLAYLEDYLFHRQIQSESFIYGMPIEKGWISSRFGWRNDPFSGKRTMHRGVDLAGSEGSAVIATAGGIVTFSGRRSGYGLLIEIDHGNDYVTRYAHNKENLVNEGDIIERGQTIGLMGQTGRSTGPHVHFEVIKAGKHVDPIKYVNRKAMV